MLAGGEGRAARKIVSGEVPVAKCQLETFERAASPLGSRPELTPRQSSGF